jgi:hypothetical protein
VINGLRHVFELWVERCKKCVTCQGMYFEKESVTAPHKFPTRSNKVSPQTLQTALVFTLKCYMLEVTKINYLFVRFKQ